MNKTELIAYVAQNTDVTKKAAQECVEAVIEGITSSLKKGEKVQIPGFGTFEVRNRAARQGFNPATKAAIKIPATKVPAFKAGKNLKDIVK